MPRPGGRTVASLSYAREYRWLLVVAACGALLEAVAGSTFLALMKPITNETFIERNREVALWLPLGIVGLFLLRGIAGYITDMAMGRAARSIARDFRVCVLTKYFRLPGGRFDGEPVASMLVRLGSDSEQACACGYRRDEGDGAADASGDWCVGCDVVVQLDSHARHPFGRSVAGLGHAAGC